MITNISLANFKRHRNLSIDMVTGINVIRGRNEGGKSSILNAVSYALFGSRALPTTLDTTVTWGEPSNSLKVSLTLTVDDATYTFTRGKSGAEVLFRGKVFVTGQGEVTAFAASLLGADSATASKLMVASQNSIRGALEEGPKALSQMIEDLAGFNTFDQILEAAASKLVLGSSAMVEDRLSRAEDSLDELLKSAPPEPDVAAHEKALGEMQTKLNLTSEQLPGLQTAADAATKAWQDGSALYLKRVALETETDRTLRTLKDADKLVKELMPATKVVVDTSPIDGLKDQIALSLDHNKRKAAYRDFLDLPTGDRWEGTRQSFLLALKDSDVSLTTLRTAITDLEYEVKSFKDKRFDSDTCSKCGQRLPNAEDIAAHNAEVDNALASLAEKLKDLADKNDAETQANRGLKNMESLATRFESAAERLTDFLVWDVTTYPGTVTWNGPVPDKDPQDVVELRRRIVDIETRAKAVDTAKAKLELAVEQMAKADEAHRGAVDAMAGFVGPDADKVLVLTDAKDQAISAQQVAKGTLIMLRAEIDTRSREHAAELALWASVQSRIDSERRFIADCKDEMVALAFNNALVKKLRAIRPVIANKLWNTVLASVSVMFSTMRKEESWVTKEGAGFMVNGQPVESLSGSTLDVLGLAIRCAMLRTFLPQCGLLVLDEPMSACDSGRSETMLGFLKSVNFQQTLLVSHEEVSETVADNLIIL